MRKLCILLVFLLTSIFGFSQHDIIIMNNHLVKEYVMDYVFEALERGHDVQDELLESIEYILILPDEYPVCELGKTDLKLKYIALDSKVTIDRLILKIILYRELSYVLGVPYNKGSVIMNRHQLEGFSYAAFDDVDIMDIELTKIFEFIDYIPKSER